MTQTKPQTAQGHKDKINDEARPLQRHHESRLTDGELAFYRCYNPHHARVGELVHVAGARWPIEECFGAGKNEVGLDHYQVRTWDAWHRHITIAMLAHTFLAVTAHNAKRGLRHTEEVSRQETETNRYAGPESTTPTHRRLVPLTLAEIRRLLNLVYRGEKALAHGLRWSTWRRRHQAQARRAHVRRHLRLQTLTI